MPPNAARIDAFPSEWTAWDYFSNLGYFMMSVMGVGSVSYGVYCQYYRDVRTVENPNATPRERVDAANHLQQSADEHRTDAQKSLVSRAIQGFLKYCGYERAAGAMSHGDRADEGLQQEAQWIHMEDLNRASRENPRRPATPSGSQVTSRPSTPSAGSGGGSNNSAGEGSSQPTQQLVLPSGYKFVDYDKEGRLYWAKKKTGRPSRYKYSNGPGHKWHEGSPPATIRGSG